MTAKDRRKIGVVTSARSDFGHLRDLLSALAADPAIALTLYATGLHLSPLQDDSLREIEAMGLSSVMVKIPVWSEGGDAEAAARQAGAGVQGFAAEFARARPDILVILGDRYDALPAALAALPFVIPIAHISGGDITEGAIDDSVRHCLTKLSHLHFPTTAEFGRRVRQLGEPPERVIVSGQPGLDAITRFAPMPREEFASRIGFDPSRSITLVTYHPETLRPDDVASSTDALFSALAGAGGQMLITAPSNDPGGEVIRAKIKDNCAGNTDFRFRESLGRELYWHALAHVDCMVGNSSSGITEAASFQLPVVNIGDRQTGRIMPANVMNVPAEKSAIAAALTQARTAAFRAGLSGLVNPYGDGHAVERILTVLKTVVLGPELTLKRFTDWVEPA
jgi:UDP-hydrolysing UDP-N-acetyl-D-glucosamine 2-epimerase